MINENSAKSYCKDDISLIENYDKAIADDTQTWHCHHRRETVLSRKDLIEIGEYYNRPAIELIFLTKSEHNRLHKSGENHPLFGKHHSEESRKKMSESKKGENNQMFGKHHSEESRKKMSESRKGKTPWMKGKHHSEESRKKISESRKGENNPLFGKHRSEETRKKISEKLKGEKCYIFGKHHSDETRQKMSEAHKGKHWYNNGVKSIRAKTCPEGFVKGRIKL